MERFWEFVRQPKNLPYIFGILSAFGVGLLRLFSSVVSYERVTAVILLVLGAMAVLLAVSYETVLKLENKLDGPATDKVLRRFSEFNDAIRASLKTADEIWLLSRTGQGWWKNYRDEIRGVFDRNGKSHLLFLHPVSEAFNIASLSAHEEWGEESKRTKAKYLRIRRENAGRFYNMLCGDYCTKLELRVTKHLAAWTLLIINPNKGNKDIVIYVELATFNPGSMDRPVFKVTPQDVDAFDRFISEFKQMWEQADTWPAPSK